MNAISGRAPRRLGLGTRHGAILVQVLVMGIIMLMLATAVMRMMFMHFSVSAQSVGSTRARNDVESALAAVNSAWAITGQVCSNYSGWNANNSISGCNGQPGTCGCSCNVTFQPSNSSVTTIPITTSLVGGRCVTTIERSY